MTSPFTATFDVEGFKKVSFKKENDVMKDVTDPLKFEDPAIQARVDAEMRIPMPPSPPPFSPLSPTDQSFDRSTFNTSPTPTTSSQFTTYQHSNQRNTLFIEAPRADPETIDYDSNEDVTAVGANIGILLNQERRALADIHMLAKMKAAASADKMGFLDAIANGLITPRNSSLTQAQCDAFRTQHEHIINGGDALPAKEADRIAAIANLRAEQTRHAATAAADGDPDETMVDSDDDDGETLAQTATVDAEKSKFDGLYFPTPQVVSKTPDINFAKYGVVGQPLDSIHNDLLVNLPPSQPAVLAADMSIISGVPGIGDGITAPTANTSGVFTAGGNGTARPGSSGSNGGGSKSRQKSKSKDGKRSSKK